MGLPSKDVTASSICLKDKKEMVFNATKNCSLFKFFSCLTQKQNLVSKLHSLSNIFIKSKFEFYYDSIAVSEDLNFQLLKTSPEKILSTLESLNP